MIGALRWTERGAVVPAGSRRLRGRQARLVLGEAAGGPPQLPHESDSPGVVFNRRGLVVGGAEELELHGGARASQLASMMLSRRRRWSRCVLRRSIR